MATRTENNLEKLLKYKKNLQLTFFKVFYGVVFIQLFWVFYVSDALFGTFQL